MEGYLFPDTYAFAWGVTPQRILEAMVRRFREVLAASEAKRQPTVLLSERELVTLASIVEKETGRPAERPRIACVFHNRLRKGMRLQTDPTVMYATFLRTGRWSKNISKADLLTPHPYNTYAVAGLPPGPIASPGAAAVEAALAPGDCSDLFFVSRNDGTHVFCPDLKCHNAAVAQLAGRVPPQEEVSCASHTRRPIASDFARGVLVSAPDDGRWPYAGGRPAADAGVALAAALALAALLAVAIAGALGRSGSRVPPAPSAAPVAVRPAPPPPPPERFEEEILRLGRDETISQALARARLEPADVTAAIKALERPLPLPQGAPRRPAPRRAPRRRDRAPPARDPAEPHRRVAGRADAGRARSSAARSAR